MNSRSLAGLISSLVSQLLIILFLLFPPSNTLTITDSFSSPPPPDFQESFFPLLHHFLTATDIASFLSFSRKRKRGPDNDTGSRLGPLGSRNPDSFKQFFRMNTSTFEWLCGLLEPLLDCRDPVDSPLTLPAETRLGIGLFRLATGADYPEISGRFGTSEADTKFCVKQLCRVLCTNYRFWVGFPSQTELDSVSAQFETLTGLPNCCGIISCTRFNVQRGNVDNDAQEESIGAQIVVDSSSRILSIVAGFRGDKSDVQILKSSTLYKDIEKGKILRLNDVAAAIPQYLIGSGEYPLLPWLLVPYLDPQPGSVEENFNNAHRLMRISLLKTLASLRNWGILNRPIKTEHKSAVACIGACSILHNMLIMREDYSSFCDEFDDRVGDNLRVASLEGNSTEEKAFVVRKTLATRAKH